MFIGCFSAAKVLLFSEICKFLGENYAGIGRFRQEWADFRLHPGDRESGLSGYRVIERGYMGIGCGTMDIEAMLTHSTADK